MAISADRPERLRESIQKHDLSYLLLSDSKMVAAKRYRIAFQAGDALVARYKKFGIDLEAASGETHHLLPVPSLFIVGADGIIKFVYSNPDYKTRIDSEALLKAASEAKEGSASQLPERSP